MADVDQKLFQELKFHFPDVPDNIVTNLMSQLGNDRNRCMEMLANASPSYLFDQPSNSCHDPLARFSHMSISECRSLNEMSGSNINNASASGTPRTLYNTSHSLINIPGRCGPIITAGDDHPLTAPVIPNDINRFLDTYSDRQTQDIPNINCSNSVIMGYSRELNISVKDYGMSNSGNQGSCSSQTVLRPIEVQHIQTSKETVGGSSQPSVLYQIRIDPSQGNHVMPSNQQQILTSNSRCWLRNPVGVNSYQNVIYSNSHNTALSSDPQPQQCNLNLGTAASYKPPVDEHRSLNLYGSQHSSQATIYLQNPAAASGNNSQFNTVPHVDRNLNSPLPGQYNHSLHSSVIDPGGLSPNVLRTPGSQSNPQAGGQIVLEIKTPGRDGGVQSHIQYFNKIPNSSPGGAGQLNTQHSMLLGNLSPLNENPVSDCKNSVTSPSYFPECPNMINIPGHNTSSNESGFLKFSHQLPNECHMQGHYPHVICHESGSFENEGGYVPDMDHRRMSLQPVDSPTHSQSSVSLESSVATRQRPRSGSLQDDPAYLQVLLSHQKSRLDKLCIDLNQAENRLHELKREVMDMESHTIERKRKKSSRFPSSVDLARLRGDNLQLQADIQLMTKEIDLFNNGQTPLGVLDPLEQQNFYKNMNTGQSGSIYASTSTTGTPKLYTSSVTTSVMASAATTSTRPPLEIPPQLPPREPRREVPLPRPPRTVVPISNALPPPAHLPVTGDTDTDGEQWSCSACTFLNHPALNKCECCEMPCINMATSPVSPRGICKVVVIRNLSSQH